MSEVYPNNWMSFGINMLQDISPSRLPKHKVIFMDMYLLSMAGHYNYSNEMHV